MFKADHRHFCTLNIRNLKKKGGKEKSLAAKKNETESLKVTESYKAVIRRTDLIGNVLIKNKISS